MRRIALILALPLLWVVGITQPQSVDAAAHMTDAVKEGKSIAFNRRKGNCLSCHAIENGESPGNFGPPLVSIANRFASKSALRARIWDATSLNPTTVMPPFGKHKILTDKEIDLIVEYIWSL